MSDETFSRRHKLFMAGLFCVSGAVIAPLLYDDLLSLRRQPTLTASGPWSVAITSGRGLAGISGNRVLIDSSGFVHAEGARRRPPAFCQEPRQLLTAEELEKLERSVVAARPRLWEGHYGGGGNPADYWDQQWCSLTLYVVRADGTEDSYRSIWHESSAARRAEDLAEVYGLAEEFKRRALGKCGE